MSGATHATDAWVRRHRPTCPACGRVIRELPHGQCPNCHASLSIALTDRSSWATRFWNIGAAAIGFLAGLTLIIWVGVVVEGWYFVTDRASGRDMLNTETVTFMVVAAVIDLLAILWFYRRRFIVKQRPWVIAAAAVVWWTPILLIIFGTLVDVLRR